MTKVAIRALVEDLAVGAVSGYLATRVMEPASMALYRWESDVDRRREDAARPGPPFQIAADQAAHCVAGIRLAWRSKRVRPVVT